jgi:hypothetical protein
MARLEVSDSDVNIDDEGDDGSKSDHLRHLEQFLGNTSRTFAPCGHTSNSDAVNRFLGNDFLQILLQK